MVAKTCPSVLKNGGSEIDRFDDSKCLESSELLAVSYPFHWSNLTPEVTSIALSTVVDSSSMSLFSIPCVQSIY